MGPKKPQLKVDEPANSSVEAWGWRVRKYVKEKTNGGHITGAWVKNSKK